jgi:hypothetical protein
MFIPSRAGKGRFSTRLVLLMTVLIATSVVRGTRQGESHGGVFLVDLEQGKAALAIDWNTANIDWQGRGWDRGLRGIAFDGDRVFIAASDELFEYTPDFEQVASYRSPFLKHCHEIARYERRLFLTSTAYDSVLGFDLDNNCFSLGLHISAQADEFRAAPFNPIGQHGPSPDNSLHLNNVFCDSNGMFISGLRTAGLLHYSGRRITRYVNLPERCHNARPWRGGVLFNDSESNAVRYVTPETNHVFQVPRYPEDQLTHTDLDDSRIARQSFARGLCTIDEDLIASGSSPSTITLHNVKTMKTTFSVNLSMDIRNAIHGLEVWPFPISPD